MIIICPQCGKTLRFKEKKNKIIIYKKCECGAELEKIGFKEVDYYKKDSTMSNCINLCCKYKEIWRFNIAHVCEFCLHPNFSYKESKCPILKKIMKEKYKVI